MRKFLLSNYLSLLSYAGYCRTIALPMPIDTTRNDSTAPASEPFAFGDFSWLNGTSRKTSPPAFDSKYFTGDVTELWLVNGWQSYGMFNQSPGVGVSIYYRPKETVDYVLNNYYGKDDEGAPHRYRFHSDDSYQLRYLNRKHGFVTKAAFSLTADFGFENGMGSFRHLARLIKRPVYICLPRTSSAA